jgi:hypothetical protein
VILLGLLATGLAIGAAIPGDNGYGVWNYVAAVAFIGVMAVIL